MWAHWNPHLLGKVHATRALYLQGVDAYISPTFDTGERWIATMQHIGPESGCWVLASGSAFQACHIPDAVPGKAELYPNPDEKANAGDSVVVAQEGKTVAGPMHNDLAILYEDVDLERVAIARRTLDPVGHYSSPDSFQLHVNTEPLKLVEFEDSPASDA